jgi:hypothetical protein
MSSTSTYPTVPSISPQKRARDVNVDAQLLLLARSAGVVFQDRDLLNKLLELLRLGVPPKSILSVLQRIAEAKEAETGTPLTGDSTSTRR